MKTSLHKAHIHVSATTYTSTLTDKLFFNFFFSNWFFLSFFLALLCICCIMEQILWLHLSSLPSETDKKIYEGSYSKILSRLFFHLHHWLLWCQAALTSQIPQMPFLTVATHVQYKWNHFSFHLVCHYYALVKRSCLYVFGEKAHAIMEQI